ncbi:exo-beta-N-acetylmuramidase NamZ domain-containing protein [Desulfallas thermosapovorans]|uniref:Uncharacterized protein YbbC (DUF1343 family) n=1 Tax=Desulfallas thermosapovorans DSM 6562 TaxID=1121431 RepID=A0A5S4ZN59_9FIRM|nr:exo-beta-N-acetylmuramidase NamZ domain-containing protein [Desulfallas thermosapovorans]TYO92725.1 uncharacterized protein YbbC (DUF1343 family) [Desulfallas thermosapovorans DSM 6562]
MRKIIIMVVTVAALLLSCNAAFAQRAEFKLGNEMLMTPKYHHLIEGKRVGLVTNQSGVNSEGVSTIDVLAGDPTIQLTALFGPEHGIDGKAKAGAYVESYTHPTLGIPVYSLYGATREPTAEMLKNVDVLVFDVQDIGARSYTYMSTLNYCMKAAKKNNKTVVVLDRPNPLGGETVDGPVMEDHYITFVGVDNLPMAHGMTAGELARFFNRKIGVDLEVVPMEGYTRSMIYQDTGLKWVQTSPNIPDLDSVFGYMATGLGEGTGIGQADQFKWIGGKGLDAQKFADLLNNAGLPGVVFEPEQKGERGGVRLNITDYRNFRPAKTGIYALAIAHSLTNFTVPKSGDTVVMFDKIMGTDKIGRYLEQGLTPQQIEAQYESALKQFEEERKQYLIYGDEPGQGTGNNNTGHNNGPVNAGQVVQPISVIVEGHAIDFDAAPFVDTNNRLMVPLRAIVEALNATVDYDEETKEITIVKQGRTNIFMLNSNMVLVDGELKSMDTMPVVKNGRTMVPVRYVGEYFGAYVNWDPASRIVTVD